MKKMLKSLAFLAVASMAGSAFAGAQWLGNSYISANGTWYQAHGTEGWAGGGAFDGCDLGTVTSIELGGQLQIGDNGNNWGSGAGDWMHYSIDGGEAQHINLAYESYGYGEYYNNMRFQSGGGSFVTTSIDVSGLSEGRHTIAVSFGPVDGVYEDGQSSETLYTAGFLVAGSSPVAETKTAVYTVIATNVVTASGDVPSGSSATVSSTYGTLGQLTSGKVMTLTLSGYAGKTVTGLTLRMHSNKSAGNGTIAMTVDGVEKASATYTDLTSYGSDGRDWRDVSLAVTESTVGSGNVVVTIEASANSLFCTNFAIAYTDGAAAGFSVTLDPASDFDVAVGETATITATPVNPAAGPVSYAWTVDGAAAGGNSYKLALDTSVPGTHTVVCSATDGASSNATASVSYKVVVDYATLPFTYSGPWKDVTTVEGLTSEGLDTDYSGGGAKFDSTGDWVQVKFNSKPGALTYDIKGNSITNGYVFDVQESADGETWTTVVSYNDTDGEVLTTTQTPKTNFLSASSRYVRFYYTTRTCNVALYNLKIDSAVFAVSLDHTETFTVDQGAEESITATPRNAEGAVTYAWTVAGTPVDTTGNVLALDTATAGGPYEVVCTATDGAGSTAAASVSYTVRVPPVVSTYTLVESADDFVVGADYLVVASSASFSSALKNELNGSRIGVQEVEIDGKTISVEDPAPIAWQIKAGEYWGQYVLFNADKGVYAAATNNGNYAQLLAYCTNDLAQWTYDLTPTGKFYNVSFPTRSLTRNSTPGNAYFATYANSGTAPRLYIANSTVSQLVHFNANGGTVTRATMKYLKGDKYPKFEKPAEREGYVFAGWYDAEQDGNRVVLGWVSDDDERTLYAHWLDRQTVKFVPNGGTCNPTSSEFAIGGTYSGLPTPDWDGHTFQGWFTAPVGGDPVANGDDVIAKASLVLYAQWSGQETQVVTFNPGAGTCTPATLQCVIGGTYPSFPTPVLAGSTFKGWYTADGARVMGGMAVIDSPTLEVFARWADIQTLKFVATPGTCDPASLPCSMAGKYPELPTPVWAGHDFLGWFTDPDSGALVEAGDPVTPMLSRTLYAHWSDAQTLVFDTNGGKCKTAYIVCEIPGTYPAFPGSWWTGHVFKGWYTAAEGGTRVRTGMDVTDEETRTIYAHWTDEPLAIAGIASKAKASSGRRDSGVAGDLEYTITFEAVADCVYEVLWTPALDGEWTTIRRWTADRDGEATIVVDLPSTEQIGFFRIAVLAE